MVINYKIFVQLSIFLDKFSLSCSGSLPSIPAEFWFSNFHDIYFPQIIIKNVFVAFATSSSRDIKVFDISRKHKVLRFSTVVD